MQEQKSVKDLIIRALFVLAIFIIIIILAFAVIKFLPKVFSSFASIGSMITSPFRNKVVEVTTDKTDLDTEEKFKLSWNYDTEETGTYSMNYKCADDFQLKAVTDDGNKNLVCNTHINLGKTNSIVLLPILKTENSYIDLPITISFNDSDKKALATGEINLNIKNETDTSDGDLSGNATITSESIDSDDDSDSTSSTKNTGTTYTTSPADLAISNVISNGKTISFTVMNNGGKASGVWMFTYKTPDGDTQVSPLQLSLGRGQGILYTLKFDNDEENGNVTITADPYNSISESNESNNTGVAKISGSGGNSGSFDEDDDADLVITDIEVGRLSGNKFTEDDEIDDNDEAAVKFTVKNKGGESTGSWRFEVTNSPFDDDDDIRSDRQDSLSPGESVDITVGFDNPDEGTYKIKVEVDSDDDVDEESESNNTKTETLEVNN